MSNLKDELNKFIGESDIKDIIEYMQELVDQQYETFILRNGFKSIDLFTNAEIFGLNLRLEADEGLIQVNPIYTDPKKEKLMNVKNSILISGFPGVGKTSLYKNFSINGSVYNVTDSDSSNFPKDDFPNNYIEHIKNLLETNPTGYIILTSTHELVRNELRNQEIGYVLVYPNIDLKDEYMKRFIERGSPEAFIKLMNEKWNEFVESCQIDPTRIRIELGPNQYLSDIIPYLADYFSDSL